MSRLRWVGIGLVCAVMLWYGVSYAHGKWVETKLAAHDAQVEAEKLEMILLTKEQEAAKVNGELEELRQRDRQYARERSDYERKLRELAAENAGYRALLDTPIPWELLDGLRSFRRKASLRSGE